MSIFFQKLTEKLTGIFAKIRKICRLTAVSIFGCLLLVSYTPSFAPLTSYENLRFEQTTVSDLVSQMMEEKSKISFSSRHIISRCSMPFKK